MRRVIFAGLALIMFAGFASAQVPAGNVFFGYSYYSIDLSSFNQPGWDRANTNGWEASFEGKVIPFLGLVADFDSHYGSQNFLVTCPASPLSMRPRQRGHHRAQLSFRAAGLVSSWKIPSLRGSAVRRRACRCWCCWFRYFICHGGRRRPRLQTHSAISMALPGRLRSDSILRYNAKQCEDFDGYCLALLRLTLRIESDDSRKFNQDPAGWPDPVFCGHEEIGIALPW